MQDIENNKYGDLIMEMTDYKISVMKQLPKPCF